MIQFYHKARKEKEHNEHEGLQDLSINYAYNLVFLGVQLSVPCGKIPE